MPIYEYKCVECEKSFDKIVKHSDAEETKERQPCECGGIGTRQISAANFELRGKWFKTTKGY